MAYTVSAPPSLVWQDVGNQGPARWTLRGTDAVTSVRVSGYITNAKALGMKKGDLVEYTKTDAVPIATQLMIVSAINADGSADLSDGLAVTATNSD